MKRSLLLSLAFTCFFAPSFVFAQASFVTECHADLSSVSANCTLTGLAPNSLIIVPGWTFNANEPTSITDTFGNSILADESGALQCGQVGVNSCPDGVAARDSFLTNYHAWVAYWNTGAHSGSDTITVTVGAGGSNEKFTALAFNDPSVTAWTVQAVASGCTTCTNSGTIGAGVTVVTTAANEFLLNFGQNVGSFSAGSGYTLCATCVQAIEYKTAATAGTYTAAMVVGSGTSNPNLDLVAFTPCPTCVAPPPPTDNGFVRGIWVFDQTVPPPPVSTPLAITSVTPLPQAAQNASYQITLQATGGVSPYTWSITSGTLPTGLSLSGADITGTPTGTGTSAFTVQATDSVLATKAKSLSLTVSAGSTTGSHKVLLTWNSSPTAVSYNVKRGTFNNGPYTTIATGVTALSYTDAAVTNCKTYYYVVTAVDAGGAESLNSNQAVATIPCDEDLLLWAMMDSRRTSQHLVETFTYLNGDSGATSASDKKFWWIKNNAGNPWDINRYDSTYLYLWITENGEQDPFNASAYKRFVTPVPLAPRFFVSGTTFSIDTASSASTIKRTVNCEADNQTLITLGHIRGVTTGPTTMSWGGDVGNQPTITLNYYWGGSGTTYNTRERFFLVKNWGRVQWDTAHWTGSAYVVDSTSTHNTLTSGGSPDPNFTCGFAETWWP